jgi:hypothetical protein
MPFPTDAGMRVLRAVKDPLRFDFLEILGLRDLRRTGAVVSGYAIAFFTSEASARAYLEWAGQTDHVMGDGRFRGDSLLKGYDRAWVDFLCLRAPMDAQLPIEPQIRAKLPES